VRPALALIFLAAAGCHEPSRSIDDADRAACAARASAHCDRLARCTASAILRLTYGDRPSCVDAQGATCLAERASPGSRMTARDLSACAAAIAAQSCDDYLTAQPLPACDFAGSKDDGVPCRFGAQCTSGSCAVAVDRACGNCTPRPRAGDSCFATSCGPGLSCNGLTCTAFTIGAPCDHLSQRCAQGLSCVGGSTLAPDQVGACTPDLSVEGAACDPVGATIPACDLRLGLYCSPAKKRCARYGFASTGGRCNELDDDIVLCDRSAICTDGVEGQMVVSTCSPTGRPGESCSPDTIACEAPAECVTTTGGSLSGTCRAPDASDCAL
jgi:hypothetical protein